MCVCLTSSWRAPAARARSSERFCFCVGVSRSPTWRLAWCCLLWKLRLCCTIKLHAHRNPRAPHSHQEGGTEHPGSRRPLEQQRCQSLPQQPPLTQHSSAATSPGLALEGTTVPKHRSQPSYTALPNLVTGYFLVPASIIPRVTTRIKATSLGQIEAEQQCPHGPLQHSIKPCLPISYTYTYSSSPRGLLQGQIEPFLGTHLTLLPRDPSAH